MTEMDGMALMWLLHQHPLITLIIATNVLAVGTLSLGWICNKGSTWILGER